MGLGSWLVLFSCERSRRCTDPLYQTTARGHKGGLDGGIFWRSTTHVNLLPFSPVLFVHLMLDLCGRTVVLLLVLLLVLL